MMKELNISQKLLKNFSKKYKTTKILITGGTRFLGKRLALILKETGCNVFPVGSKEIDLRDVNQTIKLFENNFDIVIHCAAVQGGLEFILSCPTQIFIDNQMINNNILNACFLYPPKKLIGIGSSCSYPGNQADMKEDNFWSGRLDESVFTYGFTKKALYVGQYALYKEFKIPGAHLVLGNMYGIDDNFHPKHSHVVASLIRKFSEAKKNKTIVSVWGDGSAQREFLYIDDAVEGILRALLKIDGFELLNIANGMLTNIGKLVKIISYFFDYDNYLFDTTKPIGAKRKSLNPEKCLSILNWVPSTNLEDGIEKTIEWFINNKEIRF